MKNITIKALIASTLLFTFVLEVQADVTDEIEKSFIVEANSQFSINNLNGSVEIVAWDQQTIKVNAIIEADNQEDRDRITLDMQQNDKGVKVETRYEKDKSWGFGNDHSGRVSYVIKVPRDINLPATELVNGSLIIKDVEGEVNVELINGSVKASGLMGNSEISSVNGSIKLNYIGFNTHFDKINVETVNGSIKLTVPNNLSAAVVAETFHGSLKSDFGLSNEKEGFLGKKMKGNVGSGDAKITLESVNGSIKLLKK